MRVGAVAGVKTTMHILVPIHAFEPGGVERVALRLAERWRAEGHEVTILLGRDRGPCRDQRPDLTYRCYAGPFSTAGWETVWMMACLVRYLLLERADAIFCPGLTYTAPCVVAKLLLGPCCPPVLVKVSNDLDRPDIGRLLRWPYRVWLWAQGRLLEEFVAIGRPMQQPVARALRIEPERVSVIPDPALSQAEVDGLSRPRDTAIAELQGRGRRFLAVGRLAPQKNFALLLEAFARLATPEDQLLIAGEGPCRAALERRISRLGLAAQVLMPGHVSDVAQLYRKADALVLSSNYEGVPSVVIEALAAGLPIAATSCCDSMTWLLGSGRFGALAPCGDATALASAMGQACGHHMPRDELVAFVSAFTLERAAGDYLALLGRICASPLGSKEGCAARCGNGPAASSSAQSSTTGSANVQPNASAHLRR
jgi:glycosyltransferase involved in cell wall biosynthesis